MYCEPLSVNVPFRCADGYAVARTHAHTGVRVADHDHDLLRDHRSEHCQQVPGLYRPGLQRVDLRGSLAHRGQQSAVRRDTALDQLCDPARRRQRQRERPYLHARLVHQGHSAHSTAHRRILGTLDCVRTLSHVHALGQLLALWLTSGGQACLSSPSREARSNGQGQWRNRYGLVGLCFGVRVTTWPPPR